MDSNGAAAALKGADHATPQTKLFIPGRPPPKLCGSAWPCPGAPRLSRSLCQMPTLKSPWSLMLILHYEGRNERRRNAGIECALKDGWLAGWLAGWLDGWMDGWVHECMGAWVHGCIDALMAMHVDMDMDADIRVREYIHHIERCVSVYACMPACMPACMHACMRACMHRWTDGRTDGWMEGWMDVHTHKNTCIHVYTLLFMVDIHIDTYTNTYICTCTYTSYAYTTPYIYTYTYTLFIYIPMHVTTRTCICMLGPTYPCANVLSFRRGCMISCYLFT